MAGNADVKVNITTWFDDKGLTQAERGFRRAYMQQSRAAQEMARAEAQAAAQRTQAMGTVSRSLGALGLAMTAMAVLAVATSAKFDAAMSRVSATGVGSLDALRDAAMQAGRDTAFSAIEAAEGIEQLAKAGVSANDILSGGLTATLDLAAAGQLSVAAASEITASTLKQFGLAGQDATRVADALAAGANKALGGVEDLAGGLQYVGPVAASLGVSMEETTGALAMFAEQGILGEKAGTGLRGVLMSLTAPTAQAKRAMDEYGITVYDAQGKFIGLSGIAGQLSEKLGGLDDETRQAALGQMFGNAQITAASILYSQGAGAVEEWTAAVSDAGYAAKMANDQLDNLQGDLQILRGSLETALISLGDAGQGPLRSLTQGVTGVVNSLAELPPAVQGVVLSIIGTGGLAALGGAGLMRLVTMVGELKAALVTLGVSFKTAGLAIGGVLGVVGLAVGVFMSLAQAQENSRREAKELGDTMDRLSGSLTEASRAWMFDQAVEKGWVDAANQVGLSVEVLIDAMMGVPSAVAEVNGALEAARGENGTAGFSWEQLGQAVEYGADKIAAAEGAIDDEAAAMDGATTATEANARAHETAAASVEELIAALESLNALNRDAQSAAIEWEESLDDLAAALTDNGATMDISTEKGRNNQRAMLDAAEAAERRAQTVLEQTGSEEQFIASLEDSRLALFNSAVGFGLSEEAAWAYVDSILSVPPTTETLANLDVTQAIADLASLGVTIDETTGTVTINGNPAPAEMTLGELIGNVDQSDGTVTINGNRYPADITVGQLTAWINSQTGAVTAQANTAAAETALNYLARVRYSTIFANVITSSVPASIAAPARNQGGIIGFAGGGLVPGTPPADPRADNMLATTGSGLYALRSGEWVSTEESSRRNRAALSAGNRGATLYTSEMAAAAGMGGSVDSGALAAAVADALSGATLHLAGASAFADTMSARIVLDHDRRI